MSGCVASPWDLYTVQKPIKRAGSAQRGLVVINILANLLVGLIIPLLLIYNAMFDDIPCCPGRGNVEEAFINVREREG